MCLFTSPIPKMYAHIPLIKIKISIEFDSVAKFVFLNHIVLLSKCIK